MESRGTHSSGGNGPGWNQPGQLNWFPNGNNLVPPLMRLRNRYYRGRNKVPAPASKVPYCYSTALGESQDNVVETTTQTSQNADTSDVETPVTNQDQVKGSYTCQLCAIICNGEASYKQHMDGSRHKSALDISQTSQSGNSQSEEYTCKLCNIGCTGEISYNQHINGARHKQAETDMNTADGEGIIRVDGEKTMYGCKMCNVMCTGLISYKQHMNGMKHLEKEKLESDFEKGNSSSTNKTDAEKNTADGEDTKEPRINSLWKEILEPQSSLLKIPLDERNFTVTVNKVDGENSLLPCEMCEVMCTGRISYRQHIYGKKHLQKAEELKEKGEPVPETKPMPLIDERTIKLVPVPQSTSAQFYEFVKSVKEPLLGLQHITEIMRFHATHKSSFTCNICQQRMDGSSVITHLKGMKHKLTYLKETRPSEFERMHKDFLKKTREDIDKEIQAIFPDIVRQDGSGEIKVKREVLLDKEGNTIKFEPSAKRNKQPGQATSRNTARQATRPNTARQATRPDTARQSTRPYGGGQSTRPYDGRQPTRPYDGRQPTRPYDGRQPTRPYDERQPPRPYDERQPPRPYDERQPTRAYDERQPNRPYDERQPNRPYDERQPTRPYDERQPTRPYDERQATRPYGGGQATRPYGGGKSFLQAKGQVPPRSVPVQAGHTDPNSRYQSRLSIAAEHSQYDQQGYSQYDSGHAGYYGDEFSQDTAGYGEEEPMQYENKEQGRPWPRKRLPQPEQEEMTVKRLKLPSEFERDVDRVTSLAAPSYDREDIPIRDSLRREAYPRDGDVDAAERKAKERDFYKTLVLRSKQDELLLEGERSVRTQDPNYLADLISDRLPYEHREMVDSERDIHRLRLQARGVIEDRPSLEELITHRRERLLMQRHEARLASLETLPLRSYPVSASSQKLDRLDTNSLKSLIATLESKVEERSQRGQALTYPSSSTQGQIETTERQEVVLHGQQPGRVMARIQSRQVELQLYNRGTEPSHHHNY